MANTDCCPTKELVVKEEILPENCPPQPSCIPSTIGEPTDVPGKCDSKWRYDACAGVFWGYTCDGGWQKQSLDLCSLQELDTDIINDICNTLRIPEFYDSNGCCVQGYSTLSQLAELIQKCICANVVTVSQPATVAMVCSAGEDGTEPGTFINKPIVIPTFCEGMSTVPTGSAQTPGFGGSIQVVNPATCEIDTINFPTESPSYVPCRGLFTNANIIQVFNHVGDPNVTAITPSTDYTITQQPNNDWLVEGTLDVDSLANVPTCCTSLYVCGRAGNQIITDAANRDVGVIVTVEGRSISQVGVLAETDGSNNDRSYVYVPIPNDRMMDWSVLIEANNLDVPAGDGLTVALEILGYDDHTII